MKYAVVAALLCSATGCGDPWRPMAREAGISAQIAGQQWRADSSRALATHTSPGVYVIDAVPVGMRYTVYVALTGITGPGTYALGTSSSVGGGTITIHEGTPQGTNTWYTLASGAAGTLTITRVSDVRITGRFTVTTAGGANRGPGSIAVTDGSFDLPVMTIGSVGTVPANQISRITTSIEGVAFTPYSIEATLDLPQSGTLTIECDNRSRLLKIVIPNVSGVGTYQLDAAGARWIGVAYQSPESGGVLTQVWDGSTDGNTGSVTISSITADRIVGTFNAVIQASEGPIATPLAIAGSFDVGRQ